MGLDCLGGNRDWAGPWRKGQICLNREKGQGRLTIKASILVSADWHRNHNRRIFELARTLENLVQKSHFVDEEGMNSICPMGPSYPCSGLLFFKVRFLLGRVPVNHSNECSGSPELIKVEKARILSLSPMQTLDELFYLGEGCFKTGVSAIEVWEWCQGISAAHGRRHHQPNPGIFLPSFEWVIWHT